VALFSELRAALEDDYPEPRLLYASRVLPCAESAQRSSTCAQHSASPLSVETRAAMADLSRSQYALRFRALTGRSPKSHLLRLCIHRATQLLDTRTTASRRSRAAPATRTRCTSRERSGNCMSSARRDTARRGASASSR